MNIKAKVSLRHDESLMGGSISKAASLMSSFGLGSSGGESVGDETLKLSSHGYLKNVVKKLKLNTQYIETGIISKTNLFDYSPVSLQVDTLMADTLSRRLSFSLKVKPEKTTVKVKAGKEKIGEFEFATYPATIETSWGNFTFEKSPYYDQYDYPFNLKIIHTNYDYMAQIYQREVFIDPESKRTSDVINLEFESQDVNFAKRLLKEVIDNYNREWVADKTLVSEKTLEFLDQRLTLTQNSLIEADVQIQQFKTKYNLTEIEADVAYYLRLSGELQAQLLQAETQLNIAKIIVDFVKDERNKYSLIPFDLTLADANMAMAISSYNEQLLRRNELYKANTHSTLVESIDSKIEMQRQNLLVSLANIQEGLQVTVNNIRTKEKEFDVKIGNIPTIEKDYLSLKREQEIQQTIYIFLLEMKEQSAARGINILPKLKVIDAPYTVNKQVWKA